eukprot:3009537-Heterocapsa_arctica.AAC.1
MVRAARPLEHGPIPQACEIGQARGNGPSTSSFKTNLAIHWQPSLQKLGTERHKTVQEESGQTAKTSRSASTQLTVSQGLREYTQ